MDAAEPRISFADLSEQPDPALLPWLDRPGLRERSLTPDQLAWRQDGVVIKRRFMPDALVDAYATRRAALKDPAGWNVETPYLHVPELSALALHPPLMRLMADLIGESMVLHLALTGWISTERDWHQDDYLNPGFVYSWYCAAWIALGDVDADCGPFQYIPGSHRWPLLRGERVRAHLTDDERAVRSGALGQNPWPKLSERFVVPAIEAEIAARGVAPVQFLAGRGDLLLWHGRLMHRGSIARQRGRERRSLITHYSGTTHRRDMVERRHDANGMEFAWFDHPLERPQ